MRLIDADALLEENCGDCSPQQREMCKGDPVCGLAMWIVEAPTVDAVPVVHGAWIDGRPFVNSRWKVCSVCHDTAPEHHGGYDYCPNCGAKMDLEVE